MSKAIRIIASPLPVADRRLFDTQVLTQRRAPVVLVIEAAALQLGHHKAHEVLVATRHYRGAEHETVTPALGEPVFHLVGDIRRVTLEDRLLTQATATR